MGVVGERRLGLCVAAQATSLLSEREQMLQTRGPAGGVGACRAALSFFSTDAHTSPVPLPPFPHSHREKRLAVEPLSAVDTDADDVAAWVARSRARTAAAATARAAARAAGDAPAAPRLAVQEEDDGDHDDDGGAIMAAGTRVKESAAASLRDGESAILTLADAPIIDEAGRLVDGDDELEEATKAADAARERASAAARGAPLWDEDGVDRRGGVLAKYDDDDAKEGAMAIDARGVVAVDASRQAAVRAALAALAPAEGVGVAPPVPGSDFLTAEEVAAAAAAAAAASKKKKKKKRVPRTTTAVDEDLLTTLEATAPTASTHHGSRATRAAAGGDAPGAAADAAASEAAGRDAYGKAVDAMAARAAALKAEAARSKAVAAAAADDGDDGDDDGELYDFLARARRAAAARGGPTEDTIAAAAAARRAAAEKAAAERAERGAGGGGDGGPGAPLELSTAAEFARSVAVAADGVGDDDMFSAGRAAAAEPVTEAPPAAELDEPATASATSGWVDADAATDDTPPPPPTSTAPPPPPSVTRETAVGVGLGAVLASLRDKGDLSAPVEWAGRSTDVHAAEGAVPGTFADVYRGGRHEKFTEASIEAALTERDEFGRVLTPKERFRRLCHAFHGIDPSKNRQERRLRKLADEATARRALAGGGGSGGPAPAATPFVVLSGTIAPGQSADPTAVDGGDRKRKGSMAPPPPRWPKT